MTAPHLPAVILAGGRAARMGGTDKALLPLGLARVIDHQVARLSPQCAPLAINANGDPGRFADLGLAVLADSVADHPGPLAGVLAAMDWAAGFGAAGVITVAGDTPFIPADFAQVLALAGPFALAADQNNDLHPTCGLWPVALRDDLRAALSGGTRKVRNWALDQGAVIARFDGTPFFNINTPADLMQAETLLGTL